MFTWCKPPLKNSYNLYYNCLAENADNNDVSAGDVETENGAGDEIHPDAEGDSEEKKKKKKRNRKGKGKIQTDPPSIPITDLYADGKKFVCFLFSLFIK